MTTDIQVLTKYLPSSDESLPALALQIICLADSYMLWIGTTELAPEQVAQAPSQGNLAIDWACAMPPLNSNTPAATALFRSASSDVAFGMAQRLARRFKKQIFLSIDVTPSIQSIGQGPAMLIQAERGILATLKQLEGI